MRLRKRQRLALVVTAIVLSASAAGLVLAALQDKVAFFVSPSELQARKEDTTGKQLRLGGLVEAGSVRNEGSRVAFVVTDGAASVPVTFDGILPDLFREGQGIVAQGTVGADGSFTAAEVLAKHDENYMPREVADALKKTGHWQPEAAN